jgi:lipopolysaccharide biosynthesis protein
MIKHKRLKTVSRLRHIKSYFGSESNYLFDIKGVVGMLFNSIWRSLSGPGDWNPTFLEEQVPGGFSPNAEIGVFVHAHFSENLPELADALQQAPFQCKLYVSSSQKEVLDEFVSLLRARGVTCTAALVPNLGRNFFPLFTVFKDDLMNFDIALHVHTKNSAHSQKRIGAAWRRTLWESLITDSRSAERFVNLMMADEQIAVAYPDLSSLIRPINFRWGQNLSTAEAILSRIDFPYPALNQNPFAFPVGGMMYFRPACFAELFNYPWSHEDFPTEDGQIDGTTQHSIERLFGYLASQKHLKHLIYVPDKDRFTNEETYTSRR